MQAPQVFKDADDVPRLRKRRTSHTQTETTDLLDLQKLKVASAEQQRELAAVKAELTAAYRASAEELQSQVTGTAAERDARWARKLRTVEQMHATALEHARLAGEQDKLNELAKQREKLAAAHRDELQRALADGTARLADAHAEADDLRAAKLRLSEEVAALKRAAAEHGAALEAERARVTEVELRAVRAAENFERRREEAEASERERENTSCAAQFRRAIPAGNWARIRRAMLRTRHPPNATHPPQVRPNLGAAPRAGDARGRAARTAAI